MPLKLLEDVRTVGTGLVAYRVHAPDGVSIRVVSKALTITQSGDLVFDSDGVLVSAIASGEWQQVTPDKAEV